MRTLIALAAVLAVAFGQSCSRNDYSLNTRDYLNELGKAIKKVFTRVKTEGGFRNELNANISRSFQEGGCNRWGAVNDEWIYQFLGHFTTKDGKPIPAKIQSLARSIEEYVYETGKDHIYSGCVATKIRDNLVEYIVKDCMGGSFDFVKNGLNDFPVPVYAGDAAYESKLRSSATLMAAAYLTSTLCGSPAAAARVVQAFNKKTEEDFCWAAADTFVSDPCYALYKQRCPQVLSCMNGLVDNFKSLAVRVFGDKGQVISEVKDCVAKSNAYWKGNKPASVPGAGTMLAKGLRLWREVEDAQNALTPQEKKDAAEFLKAIVKAHFRAEACDCEGTGR